MGEANMRRARGGENEEKRGVVERGKGRP